MDVVVQRVSTWWTKESRGGPAAVLRNSVPVAFRLPPDFAVGVHEVVMREQTGFEPTVRTVGASDVGLPLHVIDGSLRVRPPEISGYSMVRRSRRPPAVRLVPGEWLRWQINHRFVGLSGGEWHYRLDTFNVYFGPEPSVDVFLGDPKRLVDERTSLW